MHLPEDLEDSSNTTKLWTWCELAAWILHSLFWTHVNKLSWQGYSWLFCNYTGTDVPWPKWAFVHVVHTWTGDQVLLKVSKSFYWRQWARTMSRHSVDIRLVFCTEGQTCRAKRSFPTNISHRETASRVSPASLLPHVISKTDEDKDIYWHEVQLSNIKFRHTEMGNPLCRVRTFQWQDFELPT